jgi:single-strand DNA-binding protein
VQGWLLRSVVPARQQPVPPSDTVHGPPTTDGHDPPDWPDRRGRRLFHSPAARRVVPAGTQAVDAQRRRAEKEKRTVNRVLLTGRLTRDPEMRSLASGKAVTQFSVATNEYIGQGKERAEYHNIVTWDRLAQTCGEFLGKGQQVAIEGRIQTRSWDDDSGKRHWKTEIVANHVEMLSGRRKKDYAAESAANGLAAQAAAYGDEDEADDGEAAAIAAAAEPITEADEEVVAA